MSLVTRIFRLTSIGFLLGGLLASHAVAESIPAKELFPESEEFVGRVLARNDLDGAGTVLIAVDAARTDRAIDRVFLFTPDEPLPWLKLHAADGLVTLEEGHLTLTSEAESFYLEISIHPLPPTSVTDYEHVARSGGGLGLVRYGGLRATLDQLKEIDELDLGTEVWRLYAPDGLARDQFGEWLHRPLQLSSLLTSRAPELP